jgi:hypothetical protein
VISAAASGSTKAANAAWPLPGSSARICPLSKCSAARSQWQRALRHVFSKTALAAIRDRDPELALLEPYADRKACVQVVIDHKDVTAGFCLANQHATEFPPQITGLSALHSVYGQFHNLTPSRR